MEKKSILILEDDKPYADTLVESLQGSYLVKISYDEDSFWQNYSPFIYDLLILDIRIGEEDKGLEILKKIKKQEKDQSAIVLTQYSGSEYFFDAMESGASLFLEKKDYSPDILVKLINSIIAFKDAQLKIQRLEKKIEAVDPIEILGVSPAIKKVKEDLSIAGTNGEITVLIRGESGVGKELVAKNIHKVGRRKDKNYSALNIAGFPKELLYNELFGSGKGAYTGSETLRKGILEEGDGGIVFLDEIGDLELESQIKLLRVLEEKKFRRLGGNKEIAIDIQFVFATNKDLEKLVKEGKFREDLYFRIRQFEITVSPLRERKEDIPLLVKSFLNQLIRNGKGMVKDISDAVMTVFLNYQWIGNVRELKVVLETAFLRAEWYGNSVIQLSHLPEFLNKNITFAAKRNIEWNYEYFLSRSEISLLQNAISTFSTQRKNELAKILQYPNRFTFVRRIKRHFERFEELKKDFHDIWEMFKKD